MNHTVCVNCEAKLEAGDGAGTRAGPKGRLWLQPNTPAQGNSGSETRVGHRVLSRSVRSVLFRSLKGTFQSFPFLFRVFGDL